MKRFAALTVISLVIGFGFPPEAVAATPSNTVNCNSPNASIQAAVDGASGPTIIFIKGECQEHVLITKDDITVNGDREQTGVKGGTGTLIGSITVDGANRATIEFLTVTGPGDGIFATDGADVTIRHSRIVDNEKAGIIVQFDSFARVEFNDVTGNGRPEPDPGTSFAVYFDAGITASHGASVFSRGNLYADNEYGAIQIGNNASFLNSFFIVPETFPPDPNDRDFIIQKGCTLPDVPPSCTPTPRASQAIDSFQDSHVDLRNAEVRGQSSVGNQALLRIHRSTVHGDISAFKVGAVRIRIRPNNVPPSVTNFNGTLNCDSTSYSTGDVSCGQTCSGPGTCGIPTE